MAVLKTVTARAQLPVSNTIVWEAFATGRSIGYRKTSDVNGTWWARKLIPGTKKYRTQRLGTFEDLPQSRRFDEAAKAAVVWFEQTTAAAAAAGLSSEETSVRSSRYTVRSACEDYLSYIESKDSEQKARETRQRLTRLVYSQALAEIELKNLRHEHVMAWRQWLRDLPTTRGGGHRQSDKPRSEETINRDMTPLRAALELAFKSGRVISPHAWKSALVPNQAVRTPREHDLLKNEIDAIIAEGDQWLAPLMQAFRMLPVRPGVIGKMLVGDFSRRNGTLHIRRSKAHAAYVLKLPPHLFRFFENQSRNKLPTAPMFSDPTGKAWNKDSWNEPIAEAGKRAGIEFRVVAYSFRHAAISELVSAGVDLFTVSKLAATSVAMIERHYGHLREKASFAALEHLVS